MTPLEIDLKRLQRWNIWLTVGLGLMLITGICLTAISVGNSFVHDVTAVPRVRRTGDGGVWMYIKGNHTVLVTHLLCKEDGHGKSKFAALHNPITLFNGYEVDISASTVKKLQWFNAGKEKVAAPSVKANLHAIYYRAESSAGEF